MHLCPLACRATVATPVAMQYLHYVLGLVVVGVVFYLVLKKMGDDLGVGLEQLLANGVGALLLLNSLLPVAERCSSATSSLLCSFMPSHHVGSKTYYLLLSPLTLYSPPFPKWSLSGGLMWRPYQTFSLTLVEMLWDSDLPGTAIRYPLHF